MCLAYNLEVGLQPAIYPQYFDLCGFGPMPVIATVSVKVMYLFGFILSIASFFICTSAVSVIKAHVTESMRSLKESGISGYVTFQAVELGSSMIIVGGLLSAEYLVWLFPSFATVGYCGFCIFLRVTGAYLSYMSK